MSQSQKRLFGIISTVTGSKSPLIINKLSRSEKAAIAEKRDSTGKVIEREAYSVDRTVSISAITTTESPVNAGGTITVAGQTYLVDKADQNESNTDFVDISISAQTADTATLKPLSDVPAPDTPTDPTSGGWEIYRIKSYIAPKSIIQSYKLELDSSFGIYADAMNGIYQRKVKEGYYDRYINQEKGKVLIAWKIGIGEAGPATGGDRWVIVDLKESDSYTNDDLNSYTQSGTFNLQNAADDQSWKFEYGEGGLTKEFFRSQGILPISVNAWEPETIIANKVVGYSGDTPSVEAEDIALTGKQYTVEVGKSYVTKDGFVIGHLCFMPDQRITLVMSGMDDYDANANGNYTQNDFSAANQNSTWSNQNGYVIKYDYMGGQWGCFSPNGNVVANGGYGDSPLGATWYEMVQWSGAEVTLSQLNQ